MIETLIIIWLCTVAFACVGWAFSVLASMFKGESEHWRDVRARANAAFEERQRKRWGENWKRR